MNSTFMERCSNACTQKRTHAYNFSIVYSRERGGLLAGDFADAMGIVQVSVASVVRNIR